MPKYLSDPITLSFTLPEKYTGQNVQYKVYNWESGDLLYNGSIYATGKEQTIHLNDLLYTIGDTYDWFIKPTEGAITNSPHAVTLKVIFDNDISYFIYDIIFATKTPNSINNYRTPNLDVEELVSFNEWGTGVIPRVPRIQWYKNFFSAVMLNFSDGYRDINHQTVINICDENRNMLHAEPIYYIDNDDFNYYIKICLGQDFWNDVGNIMVNNDSRNYHICAFGDSQNVTEEQVLCYLDDEPADYYVSWINRFGAWQCQPLCAKYEMKEKVTTENIVSLINETIPCTKTSEFTWTLNTHWLTYAEHNEFESLLTSKYVYLYNTKTLEGHYVNVTDSNWTFRNDVNTKKPFNLTINVTKSMKQTITY